ncbi:MAG TPA: 3-hydroxyacyl-CoA dehydrogenase/enoyl-CoA hydratase family protein [Ktedonobacterales bacterium]
MTYNIKRAAVLGAGIMGAGIAAQLANADIPVLLLDIVAPDAKNSTDRAARNRIAATGLERALKAKPASAFYDAKNARRVTIGNTEDDWEQLREVDLIVEAVIEQLDVKHDVYARLEGVRKPDGIVTSNTSGLPARLLVEGRNEEFARHFLITHFFNPVRFLKLVELVASPATDPALMAYMGEFLSERLGKGVVFAADTPNFIANRIGSYGFLKTLQRMQDEGYKIEEVDAIFGPVTGRPRSATFRTADLAGLDTFAHVADNLYENLPNDSQRELFKLPAYVRDMVSRGWIGDKAGQGFFKRVKGPGGERATLVLEPSSMEYRPQEKVRFASIGKVRDEEDVFERIRGLVNADDRAATLAWELTADTLLYTAEHASEIAEDIVAIDNAMKWGFNWEVGPFETWDALGVAATAKRMQAEGRALPPLVEEVLANGTGTFYTGEGANRTYYDWRTKSYQPVPATGPRLSLPALKKAGKVVKINPSASLIDLGDGVLGVEFHSKMNAIDDDLTNMMREALELAKRDWRAVVIGNEAPTFSVGANLFLVVMAAKTGQWELLGQGVHRLQQTMLMLKYSETPVVVAPAGQALGGGCEIVMYGQKVQAAVETYIGLVEVAAGVIPAGGGCAAMLDRWQQICAKLGERGPFAPARHVFEIIATATVATSAYDAMNYGFLPKSAGVTWDRDRLLANAKADAIALAEAKTRGEWKPPAPPTFRLPGEGGRLVLEGVAEGLRDQGKATDYDVVVASKLAWVLTGGNASPLATLSEQDILDLEREAFLSLCGNEKTQARMEALLTTGKPLRN